MTKHLDEIPAAYVPTSEPVTGAPVVRALNVYLFNASESGVDAFVFEPVSDGYVLRERIDGSEREPHRMEPSWSGPFMVGLFKELAHLEPDLRHAPQERWCRLPPRESPHPAWTKGIVVQVVTRPTMYGEHLTAVFHDPDDLRP